MQRLQSLGGKQLARGLQVKVRGPACDLVGQNHVHEGSDVIPHYVNVG